MQKTNIIDALKERLVNLEIWKETAEKKKTAGKKPSKPEVDDEVCPVCGSDLLWVEEGIVYCKTCDEYYEEDGK